MATYTVTKAKHATLTGATADLVQFTSVAGEGNSRQYTLRVYNAHASNHLYFNYNSSTVPTVAGDDTHRVSPGTSVTLRADGEVLLVRVVGADNEYSVEIA